MHLALKAWKYYTYFTIFIFKYSSLTRIPTISFTVKRCTLHLRDGKQSSFDKFTYYVLKLTLLKKNVRNYKNVNWYYYMHPGPARRPPLFTGSETLLFFSSVPTWRFSLQSCRGEMLDSKNHDCFFVCKTLITRNFITRIITES